MTDQGPKALSNDRAEPRLQQVSLIICSVNSNVEEE